MPSRGTAKTERLSRACMTTMCSQRQPLVRDRQVDALGEVEPAAVAAPASVRTASTHGPAALTTTVARTSSVAPPAESCAVATVTPFARRSAVSSTWFATQAPASCGARHRGQHQPRVVGEVLDERGGAVEAVGRQARLVSQRLGAIPHVVALVVRHRRDLLERPEPDAELRVRRRAGTSA